MSTFKHRFINAVFRIVLSLGGAFLAFLIVGKLAMLVWTRDQIQEYPALAVIAAFGTFIVTFCLIRRWILRIDREFEATINEADRELKRLSNPEDFNE